jgi:galactose mutarotase-like enzyme
MFDIVSQEEEYLTYTLSDIDSKSSLKVVPSRGGIITQWQIQGEDILYLDQERFRDPTLSIRGGIPILFPICGNLPDNSYSYNLQTYQLKQHGFARDMPWEVIDHSTDNRASITLSLQSSAETLRVYPFAFNLEFTYILADNTLTIRQKYTNNYAVKMPFSTGLHPYFAVRDKSKLELEIPASSYQNQITKEIKSCTGNFDFNETEIDVAFRNPTEAKCAIVDRSAKRKISLSYTNVYSTIVFWTIAGKDYVCLEPWTAPRNAINTGENLLHIEPNSSYETWTTLKIEKI